MSRPINFSYYVDPDIAMDYDGLADPFTVRIPIAITNTEAFTLWFRVLLVSPPAGYTNHDKQLGSVGSGASAYKIWEFNRALPAARTTDSLTARLMAYKDAGYTDLYGQKDLSMDFHLFDHDDLTLVDHDDFDDGTLQGWVKGGAANFVLEIDGVVYLTAPYSIKLRRTNTVGATADMRKSFSIGSVTRAFVVLHVYRSQNYLRVYVDGKIRLPEGAQVPTGNWYRLVFFMPVNQSSEVKVEAYNTLGGTPATRYVNLDEVWVVTE